MGKGTRTLVVHRNGAVKMPKNEKKRSGGKVITVIVNRLVWAEALRVSGGNRRRIKIIDAETVIVRNH